MLWLWLATIIWAFSFSLIGVYLAGNVDPYIAVFSRMALACALFLPLLRKSSVPFAVALKLVAIGAIQLGLMYLLFYQSFLYLSVAEVLLFTIFTPIYVALINDLVFQKTLSFRWLIPAIVAVVGAAVIRYNQLSSSFLNGFLLVQGANLCFAFGQVAYKHLAIGSVKVQRQAFFYFMLGALILSMISMVSFANFNLYPKTTTQILVLLWLGTVASGLGYFLWNLGTKSVNPGQLSTMNNMLIPAGLLVNLLIWQQSVDWLPLILGGSIIALAVIISSRSKTPF
ncbi:MAG: EamA family transporter [Kangiellaceae bacterium]|jgi:carboxylate/amino acid/amine transporter|nr:EamA family transporter [Kangiellaceae bacterium]